jgi:hypothetical protein
LVGPPRDGAREQAVANACLIAAAPELYKALLAYHRANRIHNDADAELFAKSTAALRKARGEQP